MYDYLVIQSKNKKNNVFKNKFKNKQTLSVDEFELNQIYVGKGINPPFFKKIIILTNQLKIYDLKKIMNMCLINGSVYFPDNYSNFFKTQKEFKKINNSIYTFPKYRVVEFIIMGVQRGGTTSLSINISQHPDIYIDSNKEPSVGEVHFFDINWKKGIEWYKKKFDYNYKLVGEKTPSLIYLPSTFPLIQSVNPFVKIILVLRNPVERAYSAWKLNKKNGNEDLSFQEAISYELKYLNNMNKTFFTIGKQYLNRGFYYKQIKELLKWFPKQNILILISEIVKENMNKEYNKIYEFLNLPLPNQTLNYQLEHVSKNNSKINNSFYNKLIQIYKNDILLLEKFLQIKTSWLN